MTADDGLIHAVVGCRQQSRLCCWQRSPPVLMATTCLQLSGPQMAPDLEPVLRILCACCMTPGSFQSMQPSRTTSLQREKSASVSDNFDAHNLEQG